MANSNQPPRFHLSLTFLIVNLVTLMAEPISSFGQSPDFDSDFTLLGKAKMGTTNKGVFVNLSTQSGSGQIVYKKPFKFLDPKTSKPVSFSTQFTFSIAPGDGDGLAFVIFPSNGFSDVFSEGRFGISDNVGDSFVAVEFDTGKDRKDGNVGGLNGGHIGLDVGGFESAVVSDVSSLGLVLNGGKALKSWIDYQASMKRLEIRVGDAGGSRPYEPLISYAIDLSNMWGERDVMVGISSSGGSSQVSSLLSWSVRVWMVPSSLHSQPLNPDVGIAVGVDPVVRPKKSGFLTVLGGLIFATGCGTLVAFFVLFLWVVFFSRHSNAPPELPMNPVEFKYEKVNVSIENGLDDGTRHGLVA